ncbi:MAG: hypothetical protein IJC19_06610 [Clostridia bacterium]|nr:hypothetical protein [Clostridia bacterium]
MKKTKLKKRALSLLLSLALFLSFLPVLPFFSSADVDTRVTDASTMDDWSKFFGNSVLSTENAGGVWGDKSVFTNADAFNGYGISMLDKDKNFLVALSAMAANKSIVGYSALPTDTVMVLDLSNSMSESSLADMVEATNAALRELFALNLNNRVSVIVYAGTRSSNYGNTFGLNQSATVLLPLDRYEGVMQGGKETFLTYSSRNDTVSVVNGVLDLGYGERNPSKAANGATYIQAGLQLAWNQFKAVTDTVITDGPQKGTVRMPVLVLMSDGAPTVATTDFTNVGNSNQGNGGSISTTNSFLTQLSAVWVRTQMAEKYGRAPLFYTLGLDVENNDTARAVLNPMVNTEALENHWNNYISASGSVYTASGFSVAVNSDVKNFFETAPNTYAAKNYVTEYFQASSNSYGGNELVEAFDSIVDQIIIQSKYYPTLVESGDHNLDGFVTFTDELGEYMEVKDIKGLTVAGSLYKGSALAQSVASGTVFGDISSGDPAKLTTAGREMVKAIMTRIGCSEDDALTLAKNAIADGQLYYNSDSDYSNYIGWYADDKGNYLGYWNGGAADPSVGATYVNKSYGFVGTVGSDASYNKTDMLYVSVQVHKHIKSGHEQILYRIPASLVPMVEYKISFDGTELSTGTNFKLTVGGATEPLRLIYELGLRSDINPINVNDKIDTRYKYKGANGYTFYTNSWAPHAHSEVAAPDSHDATTFAFEPSLENERYYYVADMPIFDAAGNAVTYDPKTVAGKYYWKHVIFEATGSGDAAAMTELLVEISAESLALSEYTTYGEWVIPKGTPYRRLFDDHGVEYAQTKTANTTGTLEYSLYPSLTHPSDEVDYSITACLGNNGRFTLAPAQGIALTKTMEYPELGQDEIFTFEITLTGSGLPSEYPVYDYDGNLLSTATLASGNKLTVQVKTGQTVYVTGIPTDTQYSVVEVLPAGSFWKVNTSSGTTGTVALYEFRSVSFENTPTTYGSLLINKTVKHPFGDSYPMPENLFDITVSFNGVADGTTITVDGVGTTVSGGKLDLKIKHGQTIVINDLPADATYTVTEKAYDGFTLSGSGLTGIISDDKNAEALLVNTYDPASAELNVSHVGVKHLDGREWQVGDVFTFSLQYFNGVNWIPVSSETRTVNKDTASYSFTFDSLLAAFDFDRVGTYQFRVMESHVDIGGLVCDTSEKNFTITVVDDAFSGKLKIADVTTGTPNAYNTKSGTVVSHDTAADTWAVTTHFNNVYSVLGTAVVTVNVTKNIINSTGVPLGKDGFVFEIYEVHGPVETFVGATVATDVNGETVFVFDIDANRLGETITYKVVEVNSGKEGVHYDASEKTFTVELEDNLDGTVRAKVNGVDTNVYNTEFTNIYALLPAEVEISGVKNLTGRDLLNGEFVFELYRTDSTFAINASPVDTQQNVGNGFTLSDTLSVAGTYYYVVKEAPSSLPHVTSDTTEYLITVEVSKGTGASLKAEITSVTKNGLAVTPVDVIFNNTYTPDATHLAIFGAKTMIGRNPKNGEFTFLLLNNLGVEIDRASNNANGNFIFDEIEFTAAGTYVYTVKEDLSDRKSYIEYDESVFTVTVEVVDDGVGNLSKTVTYTKGTQPVAGIVFENEYKPAPVTVDLEGVKTMTGRAPKNNEFAFILTDSAGVYLETVKNAADGTFAFTPRTFTKAGTYQFIVTESLDGAKSYIHYDPYRVFVTVTVTDDSNGVLTANVTYEKGSSAASGISFVNYYSPEPVFVSVGGSKTMTVRNPKAGEFSFLLVDSVGNVVDTVSNRADGTFAFKALEFGEKGVYTYTVKEDLSDRKSYIVYDESVYTVIITVEDDTEGNLSYSVAYKKGTADASKVAFENKYVPAPVSVSFAGLKTMTVRDPKANEFTFLLLDSLGNPVATAKNGADGTFVFDAQTFTAVGVYTFTVKEDLSAQKTYIGYDASEFTVTVTVTDDTVGALSASVAYSHNGAPVSSVTFRNTYDPADAFVTLSGLKTLEGRQLKADDFTFVLADANGKVLDTAKNDASGNFSFDTLQYTAAGVYYYTVTEEVPANVGNMEYDTSVYTVAVTVTDNTEGVLSASVSYLKGSNSATGISFKNIYNPDSLFVTLVGQKTLTFRNPKADEFSFILTDSAGIVLDTAKNLADGSFTFKAIELNAKGIYTYTVKEDLSNPKSYIGYDNSAYTVTITVTDDDNDGILSSQVSYTKGSASATGIVFANEYNPTAATVTLNGLKAMTVRNPKDQEFSFNLLDSAGKVVETVTNGSDGKFSFATLTFTQTGTYTYTVEEDLSNKKSYIVYDETPVTVTVVVTDNTEGTLSAAVSYKKGSAVAEEISFKNVYDPADVSATVSGLKTLEGRKLKDGEFVFHLVDAQGNIIDTQKNGADGKFTFKLLNFSAAGVYTYTVIEDASSKIDHVNYDDNVYTVTVTVTDVGGALAASLSYKAKNPNNAENAIFVNVFTPVPVDVSFAVKKNIKNDTLKPISAAGYEFKLVGDGLTAPLTVKSGADGTASFSDITYTAADIGKTFNYTITEVKGDVPNMVYDQSEIKVSVEITVTEDGVIVPVIKQDGKAVEKVEASFTNTFVPASVTTVFSVKKILTNNTNEVIGLDGFEFKLVGDGLSAPLTVKSDAKGDASFSALTYTAADIGKTFNYTVTEVKGSVEYMDYDTSEIKISVQVTVNNEGEIVPVIQVNGVAAEKAVATFTNLYHGNPNTSDFGLQMWMLLALVGSGIMAGGVLLKKRFSEQE